MVDKGIGRTGRIKSLIALGLRISSFLLPVSHSSCKFYST